ncbi:Putative odorant receptor 56a [Papilio xuthus]|uniref:Putative odorant receptor 56a n=1 Tax=Papilio xuthus TaxID=66420 RepID=A0A194PDM0_PAPXU|nr:Putative odorant receptor 56a [Papilio xuthus]
MPRYGAGGTDALTQTNIPLPLTHATNTTVEMATSQSYGHRRFHIKLDSKIMNCATQSLKNLELNIEFTCFFGSYIILFLIPCYYSNLLMDKSNEWREAIYSCGWENQPNIQIRRTVLFMLARCGIPLSMRTIFHPVNLATFAEVCRQAYTIFNIMNAAWS